MSEAGSRPWSEGMKISVVGLGYVGAVTAACLARDGHEVRGIDLDPTKLDLIRSGRAPIVEDGIDDVTREAVASGNLTVTDSIDSTIAESDLIFVCVGTPSSENGSQDLTAVRRVSEQLGEALAGAEGFPVVVLRSTVYPGITESVVQPILEESAGSAVGDRLGLCFQPEFLREGSSVKDFYNPPFTVVGSRCRKSVEKVKALFGEFPGEFVATDLASAEMLKLTCNVFHALKISFANEVGRLAKGFDIDSREVMSLVCKDTSLNISTAYLRPGFAYGGSCLPKDLRAMLHLARSKDIELPVMQGVQQTNRIHIENMANRIIRHGARKVGLIGLSFKPGTDDLRESPLVTLAEILIGKGFDLRVYDPAVNTARLLGANKRYIDETIPHIDSMLCENLLDVIAHGDAIVVGQTPAGLADGVAASGRPLTIFDLVGFEPLKAPPHTYEGICW